MEDEGGSIFMIGFVLPNIAGMPYWFYPYLICAIIALPVGFFARWRGYNFWVFFITAALIDPVACLILLVIIPNRAENKEKGPKNTWDAELGAPSLK